MFIFFFSLQKSEIRFCSFGERAVPAEQPFKVMKRRRQQFCRRRLRLGVNHTLFYRILFLSAINCGSHYACAGNKEQSDPKTHHAVVTGLRRLRICRCSGRRNLYSRLLVVANLALFVLGALFGCRSFLVDYPLVLMSGSLINCLISSDFNITGGVCKQLAAAGASVVFDVTVLCAGRSFCINLGQRMGVTQCSSDDVAF